MKCKNRTLRFGAYGRSSTSLDRSGVVELCFDHQTLILSPLFSYRSTGTLNKHHHGKQKISFSRKFPFMKSRERLNKLDDEDSFENGSNHWWVLCNLMLQSHKNKVQVNPNCQINLQFQMLPRPPRRPSSCCNSSLYHKLVISVKVVVKVRAGSRIKK